MVRKLELDIPDIEYSRIAKSAASLGETPEAAVLRIVSERYGTNNAKVPGLSLMKYAGSISRIDPMGSDNEQIDADLAREYGNELDHE